MVEAVSYTHLDVYKRQVQDVLEVQRDEKEHGEEGHANEEPDDVRSAQGPQTEDRERHQRMALAPLDDQEGGQQNDGTSKSQ